VELSFNFIKGKMEETFPVDITQLVKIVDSLLVEITELLAQGGSILPQLGPVQKETYARAGISTHPHVVAQLVKATGQLRTEDAAVPSSNPAPPTVS
jgi:hypothetical protein